MHSNGMAGPRKGKIMNSQLTVRLPGDLDREVSAAARRMQLKRSDIVRLALMRYLRAVNGDASRFFLL
jgi:predicted transcriptional regulator